MTFLNSIPFHPPEHKTLTPSSGDAFLCWSRMQAEAGQQLDAIIARKERERQAGDGVFLWGVGNAPAAAIGALARLRLPVPIVFSIMKSKPKAVDVSPQRTVMWRRYLDENGVERVLPPSALVTSRRDSAKGAKTRHYALMCFSEAPLSLMRGVPFDPSAFRNVGGGGAPVGASQVTALLRQVTEPIETPDYEANFFAWLTGAYWTRLSDPCELDTRSIRAIADFEGGPDQWLNFVAKLREDSTMDADDGASEALLL